MPTLFFVFSVYFFIIFILKLDYSLQFVLKKTITIVYIQYYHSYFTNDITEFYIYY